MAEIRVGVVDEHEVFRRGVVACLDEDEDIVVVELDSSDFEADIDVAVLSAAVAGTAELRAPTVVCAANPSEVNGIATQPNVMAVLPRRSVTPSQLVAAVRAAAAGLRIAVEGTETPGLDERSRAVLRLLAEGAGTREISQALGFSERTIKATIYDIERDLGARNRAHAVAEAVRQNLI